MRHSTPATARVMTPPGERWLARRVESLLGRLPPAAGAPVWIVRVPELCDRRGAVHAGSFLRQRRMVIACTRAEFPRVFMHEWFHFVWRRAGNPLRRDFEALLAAERRAVPVAQFRHAHNRNRGAGRGRQSAEQSFHALRQPEIAGRRHHPRRGWSRMFHGCNTILVEACPTP